MRTFLSFGRACFWGLLMAIFASYCGASSGLALLLALGMGALIMFSDQRAWEEAQRKAAAEQRQRAIQTALAIETALQEHRGADR